MIVHLALPEDWAAAQAAGFYAVSTRGASIAEVGYLHACDSLAQAAGVAAHFYADVDDLVLLDLDEAALAAHGLRVVVEPGDPADPHSERFPHVYGGPIPLDVITARPWPAPTA